VRLADYAAEQRAHDVAPLPQASLAPS